MAGKFANSVLFTPASSGTADFVVSSAVQGYMTPALAGAPTGVYRYRAESADLSQWEIGEGTYTSGTVTLTRTTVLYNSAGTGTAAGQSGAGSKISFSAVPQVGIVATAQDLTNTIAFSEVTYASRFGITTATVTNVQSIAAPEAGNYLIFGNVGFETTGGGVQNEIHCDNSTTSATLDTAPAKGSTHGYHVTYLANQGQIVTQGARYYTLTAGQVVYQHAYTSFTPGSCTVYGYFFMMKVA